MEGEAHPLLAGDLGARKSAHYMKFLLKPQDLLKKSLTM